MSGNKSHNIIKKSVTSLPITHKFYHNRIEDHRHTLALIVKAEDDRHYLVLSCQKQKCKQNGADREGEYFGEDRIVVPVSVDLINEWLSYGLEENHQN